MDLSALLPGSTCDSFGFWTDAGDAAAMGTEWPTGIAVIKVVFAARGESSVDPCCIALCSIRGAILGD